MYFQHGNHKIKSWFILLIEHPTTNTRLFQTILCFWNTVAHQWSKALQTAHGGETGPLKIVTPVLPILHLWSVEVNVNTKPYN